MNFKQTNTPVDILKPKPLQAGDTVMVVSPSSPSKKKRLYTGEDELESWGYNVKLGQYVQDRQAYFSASTSKRLEDLVNAFTDPEIKAVFCARGGYGAGRLIREINYDLVAENPKIFLGFSDLTALSWAFFTRTGLVTFSGPMVCEVGDGLPDLARSSLNSLIGAESPPESLWDGTLNAIRPGKVSGRLFPGCLSIITSLLGTPYLPDLDGAILVIEEVAEKPYRIDRLLTHLKNAGIFDRISALIVGGMVDCWPKKYSDKHLSLEEILIDLTSSRPIPIFTGLPYGHFLKRITLPIGVNAEISEGNGLRLLEDPLDRV